MTKTLPGIGTALALALALSACQEDAAQTPALGRVLAATQASTGVCIPLYIWPGGSSLAAYDRVVAAKAAHPNVPIIAIVNPDSGPGSSPISAYVTQINRLKAAGVIVLGYVPTHWADTTHVWSGYGSLTHVEIVRLRIRQWRDWYNPSGIHFDEMANTAGRESYYRDMTAYAKSLGLSFVSGNPGTRYLSETYVGTVDNMHVFENGWLPSIPADFPTWHAKYDKSNYSCVSYNITTFDVSWIDRIRPYAGWIYVTEDLYRVSTDNPYDTLTRYFEEIVARLDVPPADTAAPVCSIVAPAPGATVSGTVAVEAAATDDVGVTRVELYVDGALHNTELYAPYTYSIDSRALADGSHALVARAYDAAGNVGVSPTASITVRNLLDTTAPGAPALLSPIGGVGTRNSRPAFDWTDVSDPSGGVTYRIQVDDGADFSSRAIDLSGIAASSYLAPAALPDGLYFWRVRAKDGAGNIGVWSAVQTFRVDTAGPTLAFTSPLHGQTIARGRVFVEARASDASAIDRVEFLVNGRVVFTEYYAPYNRTFDFSPYRNQWITLSARGYDVLGNSRTVSIQVRVR